MRHLQRRDELPVHPVPEGAPEGGSWRLRVEGLVKQPLTMTVEDLRSLPRRNSSADFVCEEGWVVPELRWDGIPVREVLLRAGVVAEAKYLVVGAGRFTVALPLDEALGGGALLADSLGGAPLTPEHGGPYRLVAPGRACFFSVKWVDRLVLGAGESATTGEGIARSRIE